MSGLQAATRKTTKGSYSKGGHSFDILATLDPKRVASLPRARLFLETLGASGLGGD